MWSQLHACMPAQVDKNRHEQVTLSMHLCYRRRLPETGLSARQYSSTLASLAGLVDDLRHVLYELQPELFLELESASRKHTCNESRDTTTHKHKGNNTNVSGNFLYNISYCSRPTQHELGPVHISCRARSRYSCLPAHTLVCLVKQHLGTVVRLSLPWPRFARRSFWFRV